MQEIDSDIRSWIEFKGGLLDGSERHEKAIFALIDEVKELRSTMAFFRGALAFGGFLLGGGVITGLAYALLA